MALAVLILHPLSIILPAGAAGQEDSENNLTVSKEGFFDRFITYVKNLFQEQEGELQSSEAISKTGAAGMQQSADSEEEQS